MSTTIIAVLTFIAILSACGIFLTKAGNFGFWKLASKLPSEFMKHIANDDAWVISSAGNKSLGDEYVGPFKFAANQTIYTLFAKKQFIKKSQQEFISQYTQQSTKLPFPILSFVALIYPIGAIISFKGAPLLAALGYGFANLGYLLVAACIFGSSFRAFGLENRIQIIVAAVVFWVIGIAMTNV